MYVHKHFIPLFTIMHNEIYIRAFDDYYILLAEPNSNNKNYYYCY